eukprot:5777282-Pleurochrysis_carterae.AAC.1
MQIFRSACVREALRRDADSEAYMQRRDYLLRANGFTATKVKPKSELGRLSVVSAGAGIAAADSCKHAE